MASDRGATTKPMVERVIQAPRVLVWRAWSDAPQFARWFGPAGFEVPVCEFEFREGAPYRLEMRGPGGQTYGLVGTFVEIVPLERIVMTQSPAGEPGMPSFETTVEVELADAPDGGTRVTVRQVGWPSAEMAEGAMGGWAQALEKLEATLANA